MTTPTEVAIPGSTLRVLRRSLQSEVGPLATVHALQAAGYRAGEDLLPELVETARPHDLRDLPEGDFWSILAAFFVRRGWGRLVHRAPHPAVGILATGDWIEAEEGQEDQPTCAFTSGLLSSILTEVAQGPVAVLELQCRSRGDGECRFAFGAEGVIHELYGELLDGMPLEDALAHL